MAAMIVQAMSDRHDRRVVCQYNDGEYRLPADIEHTVVPNLADEADLASILQVAQYLLSSKGLGRRLIRLPSLVHTMQNLEVLNIDFLVSSQ
jgi:hypothetical protein